MTDKTKNITFLLIGLFLVLSVLPCAADESRRDEFMGVWYLQTVYSPQQGSFGEDYLYPAEYGTTDMMVILEDSIQHMINTYDKNYDESKKGLEDILTTSKAGQIDLFDGKIFFIDENKDITHVYSKTNPQRWYEDPVNKNAVFSDFAGKWNMVSVYEPYNNKPFAFDADNKNEFFRNTFRLCFKNWSDYESAPEYLDQSIYLNGESGKKDGVWSFMSSETEYLDGKFSAFSDEPWVRIETSGKPSAAGKYKVTFYEMYGSDTLISYQKSYTEQEWTDGIIKDNGTFTDMVWLYQKSFDPFSYSSQTD